MPASPSDNDISLSEAQIETNDAEDKQSKLAHSLPDDVITRMKSIQLLVCDVDGTLTNGDIQYQIDGELDILESKTFSIKDGMGIVVAQMAGLPSAWVTGRKSAINERRAKELGVKILLQNVQDKEPALREVSSLMKIPLDAIAYMGDDWNDIPAFAICGIALAPSDAAPEVLARAHWISRCKGGDGAVRDAISTLLTAQGRWDKCLNAYLTSIKRKRRSSFFDAAKDYNVEFNKVE